MTEVLFPAEADIFSSPLCIHTGSGTQLAYYPTDTKDSLSRIK